MSEEGPYTGVKVFVGAIALLAVAAVVVAISVGDTSNTTSETSTAQTSATTQSPAPVGPTSVKVGMGDDFFNPKSVVTPAGSRKITAVNNGNITHELVLARKSDNPAKLPTKPDGSVNEDVLNSPGEIPDVAAGETKSTTIALKPGKYVMFCNVPGHYAAGMYGSFTVR